MRGQASGEGSQMGGGEPDRPSRSAGIDSRDGATGIDRRTFIRRAGQTGVAAGALVWSTPRIHSLDTQAAAGSPPPTNNTTPTVLANNPIPPGDPGSPSAVVKGIVEDPGGGGGLAITGAELGQMAALGAAAVGTGELLRRRGLHRRRAFEADVADYGEPSGESPEPA